MAKLKLGKRVEYRDADGFRKLEFITGTAETVKSGGSVPVPGKDEAHLHIVSPTGKQYDRQSVRLGDGPRTFSLI